MATVALTTADQLEVVEWGQHETLNAAANLSAGTFAREDANGNLVPALATTATNAAGARLVLRTVGTGEAVTVMKSGVVAGFTVTQAFNAPLFISDTGMLADAAGTGSYQVGRVIPGTANQITLPHDKLIRIDCPN